MDALVRRFERLTGSGALGAALVARYAEPHRRYHSVEHLEEVLAAIDDDGGDDPVAVELAAWFHDAIYDATAPTGESEAASAALAVDELSQLGIATAEVERLVLLTAGHMVDPDDRNGAALADADLAILGADPERYQRYAAGVRAEYAHVPDDAWRAGRAAVLRGFLDRPRLFHGDRAHARLDGPARANLAAELSALAAP